VQKAVEFRGVWASVKLTRCTLASRSQCPFFILLHLNTEAVNRRNLDLHHHAEPDPVPSLTQFLQYVDGVVQRSAFVVAVEFRGVWASVKLTRCTLASRSQCPFFIGEQTKSGSPSPCRA
jgi:predicted metal-binding protein